jgi:hypothetical protein
VIAPRLTRAKTPLHEAGMRLSGAKRFGTPEQVAEAEREVAALWLERYVQEAIAKGVDRATRHRLAKWLIAGSVQ